MENYKVAENSVYTTKDVAIAGMLKGQIWAYGDEEFFKHDDCEIVTLKGNKWVPVTLNKQYDLWRPTGDYHFKLDAPPVVEEVTKVKPTDEDDVIVYHPVEGFNNAIISGKARRSMAQVIDSLIISDTGDNKALLCVSVGQTQGNRVYLKNYEGTISTLAVDSKGKMTYISGKPLIPEELHKLGPGYWFDITDSKVDRLFWVLDKDRHIVGCGADREHDVLFVSGYLGYTYGFNNLAAVLACLPYNNEIVFMRDE